MQDCSGEADRVVQSIRHDYQSYHQVWVTCANQVYFLDVMEDSRSDARNFFDRNLMSA